nr:MULTISPECIES: CRISPR-associated endonuclease Cas1 [unclassified Paenibacillus]
MKLAVELDACIGFLHRQCPGRASWALDMMEELLGGYDDHFLLTLINKKENGLLLLQLRR